MSFVDFGDGEGGGGSAAMEVLRLEDGAGEGVGAVGVSSIGTTEGVESE